MIIFTFYSSLAVSQSPASDPILKECHFCSLMHTVTMPQWPICLSSSEINVAFHTGNGGNIEEVLVRVYFNQDPVPIHAVQLQLGHSTSIPIYALGLYTVVIDCYEIIEERIGAHPDLKTPWDRRPIGQCVYTEYFGSGIDNNIIPTFSINNLNSAANIKSALSMGEVNDLDWAYDSWLSNSLCSSANTSHRFYLDRLDPQGNFINNLAFSPWTSGCPTQSAGFSFPSSSYIDFIQNDIIQYRLEVNYAGCINEERLQFRYLGENNNSNLQLQIVRHAATIVGDDDDYSNYPNITNRAEKFIIQECGGEEMPFFGTQFLSVTHPNFYAIKDVTVAVPGQGPEEQRILFPVKDNISKYDVTICDKETQQILTSFTAPQTLTTGEFLFSEENFIQNQNFSLINGLPLATYLVLEVVNDTEAEYTIEVAYHIDTPSGVDIVSGSCDVLLDTDDGLFYKPTFPAWNGVESIGSVNGSHLITNEQHKGSKLTLYNMSGVLVHEGMLTPDWQLTVLPGLSSGMYIYHMHTSEGLKVGKVVRQ